MKYILSLYIKSKVEIHTFYFTILRTDISNSRTKPQGLISSVSNNSIKTIWDQVIRQKNSHKSEELLLNHKPIPSLGKVVIQKPPREGISLPLVYIGNAQCPFFVGCNVSYCGTEVEQFLSKINAWPLISLACKSLL